MQRSERYRASPVALGAALLLGAAPAAAEQLRVAIQAPAADGVLSATGAPVEVRGRAEILGSRAPLDVFLVLDSSKSLRRTDPEGRLGAGARALVWNLLALGRTRVGIVDFDSEGRIVAPLSARRDALFEAVDGLDQKGHSNLAAGIRTALEGLEAGAEPASIRVALLFTDGRSEREEVLRASREARERGIAVHTVLVGGDAGGEELLREIAADARGTFVRLTDPASLSRAFLGLRSTGVEEVTLSVDGGAAVPARIAGGSFLGQVELPVGGHRISATARSPSGRTAEDAVTVTVRAPACAELELRAVRDGRETLSLAERSVEIVLDASNSMWGRLGERTKLAVARQALAGLLSSLPPDLRVGLRAYGHRHRHELHRCEDSELLVPPRAGSREPLRRAIAGLEPRGQTPLAHSLAQVARDFEGVPGERAVVLVTDGRESCGGDPVATARELRARHALPVHVIGFGLAPEDAASLRAIADASGGRFLGADDARELRDALAGTLGTAFRVHDEAGEVAAGTLGGAPLRLAAGDYTVRLEGEPSLEAPVTLVGGERLTLTIEADASPARPAGRSTPAGYAACGAAPEPHPAAPSDAGR